MDCILTDTSELVSWSMVFDARQPRSGDEARTMLAVTRYQWLKALVIMTENFVSLNP